MENISPIAFWLGILTVLVPQLVILISKWRESKMQAPLTEAQSESAMGDALEKLGQAYDRALGTIKSQDEELKGLRPLILDIALTKQSEAQSQLDKADWKAHALKLTAQLEENKVIPLVFKRQSANGDSDKMRAITAAQIKKYLDSGSQETSEEK